LLNFDNADDDMGYDEGVDDRFKNDNDNKMEEVGMGDFDDNFGDVK
jgi:hypothetical protein